MSITSVSWFIALLAAIIALIASGGVVFLDVAAFLLFGHALIQIRTGKGYPPTSPNSSAIDQVAQLTLMSWSRVKLGGVAILLLIEFILVPIHWRGLGSILLGLLSIELIAVSLLECSLRFGKLGNAAILILLVLFFWSIRVCSTEIVEFILRDKLPDIGHPWIGIYENWQSMVIGAVTAVLLLLVVIRLRPIRSEKLTVPRLWLFK